MLAADDDGNDDDDDDDEPIQESLVSLGQAEIKGVSKLDRHPRADKTNKTQMLRQRAGHLFI